jgi:hypothetical protein
MQSTKWCLWQYRLYFIVQEGHTLTTKTRPHDILFRICSYRNSNRERFMREHVCLLVSNNVFLNSGENNRTHPSTYFCLPASYSPYPESEDCCPNEDLPQPHKGNSYILPRNRRQLLLLRFIICSHPSVDVSNIFPLSPLLCE